MPRILNLSGLARFARLACLGMVALVALPSTVQAQQICFSMAAETNEDGPQLYGIPNVFINEAAAFSADGEVDGVLLVQPFCDSGSVVQRKVEVFYGSEAWNYLQQPFSWGMRIHNWSNRGYLIFWDRATNDRLLTIEFNNALLTSWSPSAQNMGKTATWQVSERVDPNMTFTAGPALVNIMAAAGFPANQLHFNEQAALTLTNLRDAGGHSFFAPLDPVTGEWLKEWLADSSFSAVAGN